MRINDYFYPAVRRFANLNEGDCFVLSDMPSMKIKTTEDGEHPTNAVMLGDGLTMHIPDDVLVFLAKVDATVTLQKEDRCLTISAELEKEITE